MKHILLTVSALLCFGLSYSQPLTTTLGVEATDLADRLQGEGVIILNPELYCHWVKQGLYEDEADILGRILLEIKGQDLATVNARLAATGTTLNPGNYFITVRTDDITTSHKVIKL